MLAADFDFGRRHFPGWKLLSGIRFPERLFGPPPDGSGGLPVQAGKGPPPKMSFAQIGVLSFGGPRTHEQGGIFLQLVGLRVLCCQLCLLWKTEVFPSALGFATGRSAALGNPFVLDPSERSGLGVWWANSFQGSSAFSDGPPV